MKKAIALHVALCAAALATVAPADGHSGRRFNIEVVDGKLQAQGVNTGPDDGAPAVRPYLNAIHSHWANVPSLGIATASLPGFDVPPTSATPLLGAGLELEWLGVSRWVDPPMMPPPGTIPALEPLDASDAIRVTGPTETLDSTQLGTFTLLNEVVFGGVADLDPFYEINATRGNEIHVLEFRLHAVGAASPIEPSDTIHVLLSPDGENPMERLHHASLYLERFVATVPEPTTLVLATLLVATTAAGRRRTA